MTSFSMPKEIPLQDNLAAVGTSVRLPVIMRSPCLEGNKRLGAFGVTFTTLARVLVYLGFSSNMGSGAVLTREPSATYACPTAGDFAYFMQFLGHPGREYRSLVDPLVDDLVWRVKLWLLDDRG